MDNVQVYVVVEEDSAILEQTCRAAGAGLLRIQEDNTFDLLVDPTEYDAAHRDAEFSAKVSELRRRLESKLNLQLTAVQENFARVNEMTSGMLPEKRDGYIRSVEETDSLWRGWGDEVSQRLDEVDASRDGNELKVIERMIVEGAVQAEEEEN
jgi:hypothetical protein